jgi:DHA3 family macrolide efflux protein-like MFS transporter
MRTFILLWLGQAFSLFGTAMTRFGLTIWAYQQTGRVTTLALMGFFNAAAFVLFSPLAGVVTDRWPRKWVIALSDLGAGLATLGLLVLYLRGGLQIWHLYLAGVVSNSLGAFQEPAFSASVSLLVAPRQLVRANGLLTLAQDGARMFAPLLGGALLLPLGVDGIMLIDLLTCLAAVAIVVAVRIPQPLPSPASQPAARSDLTFGFRYILAHTGLLGILLIFAAINLFAAITYFGVMPAMILARTANDAAALGLVQSVLGVGGVLGGVLLGLWGGPRNRLRGFLLSTAASFLLGDLFFAIGRSLPVWVLAALLSAVFIPVIISCYESIWQSSVPPVVQGRVFSAKNVVQVGSMPLGYLLAGFLADQVFEPAMAVSGPLASSFGWLVGVGPGAGMGLMFACTCLLGTTLCLFGLTVPAVREVEKISNLERSLS